MSNMVSHKANELRPETRAALEVEFGRLLRDEEYVSIMAFVPGEEPSAEARSKAAANLRAHFAEVDRKAAKVSDEESEAAIMEALRHVRPGYREIE